ncbi:MAG: hypothetical protein HY039_00280 [Nitrospirae bacterium]|nr:hypothetical protein [Nitrospirota bacterium]
MSCLYGSLTALILLPFWVFYLALTLVSGAEYVALLSESDGRKAGWGGAPPPQARQAWMTEVRSFEFGVRRRPTDLPAPRSELRTDSWY